MPRKSVTQKLLLLHAILLFPEDILETIKGYLFYEKSHFRMKKLKDRTVSIIANNTRLEDDTQGFITQWAFGSHGKRHWIQLQAVNCGLCGNYYAHHNMLRNDIEFCDRIQCRCAFD